MRAAPFLLPTVSSWMKTACSILSIRCASPSPRKSKRPNSSWPSAIAFWPRLRKKPIAPCNWPAKRAKLVERDGVVQAAHARSEQIIAQGRAEAEKQKEEADEYVLDTLQKLEIEMERVLTQVRNGVHALQSERLGIPEPQPLETENE